MMICSLGFKTKPCSDMLLASASRDKEESPSNVSTPTNFILYTTFFFIYIEDLGFGKSQDRRTS